MKAALFAIAVQPPPASSAYVLTFSDRASAWFASDARVALKMQRVYREVLVLDVAPEINLSPVE
jgi:hypothetical protein